MTIGTRSILYGAHAFWLHPWFVAVAWWKLYGFPWDPRLWVAFFVHDLGYIGMPNMDGTEGEEHPILGAKLMSVFGSEWSELCLLHSRFYAKKQQKPPSKLCFADKLATCLVPAWLYLPMVRATGELAEYRDGQTGRTPALGKSDQLWFAEMKIYMLAWCAHHIDGEKDTWTNPRKPFGGDG